MKLMRKSDGTWADGLGYRKKPVLNAGDLHSPGALVQIVVIPPKTSVGRHFHEQATEVFHIVSGVGRMCIDGHDLELHPGDTVSCEPGDVHDARNDTDDPFEYVVFKTNWDPSDSVWLA